MNHLTKPSPNFREFRKYIFILCAILAFITLVSLYTKYIGYFGWNYETCIKDMYFYVNRLDRHIPLNKIFVFKFKGSKLYPSDDLFVKFLKCAPKDRLKTIKIKDHYGYYCNGKYLGYGRNYSDHGKGFKLPHFIYNGIVPKGDYFAMGTAWDSYDSRYWGFVKKDEIVGIAYPLIK